jgi:hypothetical protein
MEQRLMQDEYQIESDGRTVWINHSSGYNMARFGVMGIDIHNSPDEQERTGQQCLSCTHGPTTAADWDRFVEAIEGFFGIEVGDQYRPSRF